MPLLTSAPTFEVLHDPRPTDTTLPAFMVSTTRGFLPRMDPIAVLPAAFAPLEALLGRMPVKTASGAPGLLASGGLGDAVRDELPDLTDAVETYKEDLPLQNALYRDYSFLASAYLLEPCHLRHVKGEGYGLARDVLPRQVAGPIARCAELCGFKPFMEYAGSYALYNYRLADPTRGLEYDNLRLIRAFEHGLDPTSSEAGFVLVHVAMVKNSGPLVAGVMACLEACSSSPSSLTNGSKDNKSKDRNGVVEDSPSRRQAFNAGLADVLAAMRRVNAVMEQMWDKSKPRAYTSFRTFIFGITSQSMFPNGVVYEGINDDKPLEFRGESGANDSMIPLMDNFLQIGMPDTPLTAILRDFRSYRPGDHKRFLEWVQAESSRLALRPYALALDLDTGAVGDDVKESRALWLQLLNEVRDFRWRHWCFAREYILKQTRHPTATGGSPIVTWLPNQLQAVMDDMVAVYERCGGGDKGGLGSGSSGSVCDDIMELVRRQQDALRKEVSKYCEERGL